MQLRNGLTSLFEQFLLSAANLVTTLLMARALPEAEFAAAGLAVILLLVVGGIHRNVVIIPMVIHIGEREGPVGRSAAWNGAGIALATALAVLCLALGLAGRATNLGPAWMAKGFICGAIVMLPMLAFDQLRRWLIGNRRQTRLLAGTATLLTVQVGALGVLVFALGIHNAYAAAGSIALGAACGTVVGWQAMARSRKETDAEGWWPLLRRLAIRMRLNVLGHLALMSYTQATVILLGLTMAPSAIALFLASRTLINPVATIFTAVDNTYAFRLVRARTKGGPRAVVLEALRQIGVQLALAAPFIALVLTFAGPLSASLLGPAYAADTPALLFWWVLPYATMLISLPLESAMQTLGLSGRLLASRLCAATVGSLSILYLSWQFGLSGAIIAMTLGLLAGIAFLVFALRPSLRQGPKPLSPPAG